MHPAARCAILIIEKGKTTAHKGLTSYKMVIELPPCYWSKFWGGFLCLKHYLINVNTNVSNARMNIPKAIRSLKSKCFISTTPILCKNRGQPPCNTVVFLVLILPCRFCLCNHIILLRSVSCCIKDRTNRENSTVKCLSYKLSSLLCAFYANSSGFWPVALCRSFASAINSSNSTRRLICAENR